ncbi:MAG: hypothetical protein V4539_21105 [Bacteroidota bacterium]
MGTIKIQRTSEYNNLLRDFGIYIDGQKVGTIAHGETKEFPVTPGPHIIYSKIDWCSSPQIPFEITGDGNKVFKVGGFKNGNWIIPLALGIIILDYALSTLFGISYLFYLIVPGFLLLVYYLTIGRKRYLSLSEITGQQSSN